MASVVPAKSILKQPASQVAKASTVSEEQRSKAALDQRNLNIALHHANLIQQQKDVTAHILDAIVHLLEFPTSDPFTTKDALTFVRLLQPFQPSDFDNLVEERRIDGKCGYTLCAQQPRSQTLGQSAAWKLKAGAGDFCSNACARKAVYLKSQLLEVPAWERARGQRVDILLHEDDRPAEDADAEVRRARRAERVEAWRQKVAGEEELAKERGERKGGFRPQEVMTETVVEKVPRNYRPPMPPSEETGALGVFAAIEGYEPKRLTKPKFSKNDSYEDESDDD